MFNEGDDVTWYMGTRYQDADEWQLGRKTGTSIDTSAATTAQSLIKVTSAGNATFTGHVSATQFRPTNIVTNKVVKFNGTQLDDSTITDTGSAITLGSATTISNKLFVDGSYSVQKGTYSERTFTSGYFANGTSNLGILLELQNVAIQGMLKITLSGSYSHQNITGELEVIIPFGFNPGSGSSSGIWGNGSNKAIRATGGIADAFTIGDLAWSSSTQRHYIPIYKINSHGNSVKVRVQYFGGSAQEIENFNLTSPAAITIPTEYQTKHKSITQGDLDLKGDLYIPGYINHTGDSGTAIGFDANDVIRLKTASSTAMQIDSSQNVKVVAGKLQISGDNDHFVELVQSGNGDFTIDAPDDIRLDAGGADIVLKSGGTEYSRLTFNNPGLNITTSETNASIYLTPNGTGNVYASTDTFIVSATEGETAKLLLRTDESDDNGDDWYITNETSNNLEFTNDRTGSQLANLTLTPQGPSNSAVATFAGNVVAGNRFQTAVGSAGAPTYTFTGKTDTGMYAADHSSNDRIRFSVDGTNRFDIDANGITSANNIYVGTNSTFRNYSGVWKATTGTSGNGFQFYNTADNSGAVLLSITSDSSAASASVATFAGTIGSGNINISDGTPVLTLTDTSSSATVTHTLDGVNYQIANNGSSGNFKLSRKVGTTERVFLHAHDNGNVYLYGTGTLAQTISGANTTFAGNVNMSTGQSVFISGTSGLRLTHDGTNGHVISSTGKLRITNGAQDEDIEFRGNDGGSSFTALTLDMSEAGYATFNSTVEAPLLTGKNSLNATVYELGTSVGGLRLHPTGSQVKAGTGTKADPTFTFTNDTNTGMYQDGADHIKFTAGGNDMLRVNSTSGKVDVVGSLTVSSNIEDRNIPCIITAAWNDGTSTTDALFVPLNGSLTEVKGSSVGEQHYFVAPQACILRTIFFKGTGVASSGTWTTQIKIYKNGTNSTSSSELAYSGGANNASISFTVADGTSDIGGVTFAAGDEVQIAYQKSATGKNWGDVTMTAIIELTDYDI